MKRAQAVTFDRESCVLHKLLTGFDAPILQASYLDKPLRDHTLGTTQPKVSDLFAGKLAGFSMERLMRFLNALDRDVRIVVLPSRAIVRAPPPVSPLPARCRLGCGHRAVEGQSWYGSGPFGSRCSWIGGGMSPKTNSSRALKAVVIGVVLEEGTRLARKYGPALLDKMTEQVIDKGPGLVAKGWEKAKTDVPPAARKLRHGAAAAGRWVVREAKSLRHSKDGAQECTEVASPDMPEGGNHEKQEPPQG